MNNTTPPPNELTWAHIERESLVCPILLRMWHLDQMDNSLTREQVMIGTLLWFSRNRREMIEQLVNKPGEPS